MDKSPREDFGGDLLGRVALPSGSVAGHSVIRKKVLGLGIINNFFLCICKSL